MNTRIMVALGSAIASAIAPMNCLAGKAVNTALNPVNTSIEVKDRTEVDGELFPVGSQVRLYIKDKSSKEITSRYQWQRNGVSLDGSNRNEIVIDASPATVGFYTCFITETRPKPSMWDKNAQKTWVTAPYEIQVISRGSIKLAGADAPPLLAAMDEPIAKAGPSAFEAADFQLISSIIGTNGTGGGEPFIVTASPLASSGTQGTCPGAYKGYINFRKSLSAGWGWSQISGASVHRATDPNRTTTKVEFIDKNGLMLVNNCNTGFVDVPVPYNGDPSDVPFRFTIYFPTGPIPTSYSIRLEGFNP